LTATSKTFSQITPSSGQQESQCVGWGGEILRGRGGDAGG